MIHIPILNDRQRVELLVIPATMSALVRTIDNGLREQGVSVSHIVDLLNQACREPLADLDDSQAGKIARRAMRATTTAMRVITTPPAPSLAVQWLSVARLTIELTEEEILIVNDGSAFSKAWDEMRGIGLGHVSSSEESHAEAMAVSIREALKANGLFL